MRNSSVTWGSVRCGSTSCTLLWLTLLPWLTLLIWLTLLPWLTLLIWRTLLICLNGNGPLVVYRIVINQPVLVLGWFVNNGGF